MLAHERHAILFLVRHAAWGAIGAAILEGMVLAADVGGLRSLALTHADGWLSLGILYFGLFVTCGGVSAAAAVMSLGNDDPRS